MNKYSAIAPDTLEEHTSYYYRSIVFLPYYKPDSLISRIQFQSIHVHINEFAD
jgi:hypothetical protein